MGLAALNPPPPGAPGTTAVPGLMPMPMQQLAGLAPPVEAGQDAEDADMEADSDPGAAAADAAASLGLDVPAIGPVAPGLSSDDMEAVSNV